MPGLEKKLARYPQFYSRIGFVHEFRPLAAKEVRELLDRRWAPPGVCLPQQPLDAETVATIIRITGGNFRLLNRLLTQIERIGIGGYILHSGDPYRLWSALGGASVATGHLTMDL
jgi:hypothetical protein